VSAPPSTRLDVRAFACPLTWVKAKVALDRLAVGEVLEVWLRAGEPAESVPRSAEEDGHRLLALEPLPGGAEPAFRVLLQKGAPPPASPLP
jgi:TusA-related sulfurtransferase